MEDPKPITMSVQLECISGSDLAQAVRDACDFATKFNIGVHFKFNDRRITVKPETNPDSVVAKYENSM